MDPHSTAPKKNTSHGNEVLMQDTTLSYKDHVTNKEVHAKIQQAIGPHKDLLTIIKRCKLQWYGHVSRSSGLANLARHSERGKKTRQTEEEVGRQHPGIDRL